MAIRSCQVWFVEKFENNVAVLLFAGCKEGCHDALDKTTAFFALSTKADFSPKHALADCPLGNIVRWLDTLVVDECPDVLLFGKKTLADPGHRACAAHLPVDEKIGYLDSQFFHPMLEGGHEEGAVSDPVPPVKHQVGFVHQLLADLPGGSRHFRKALEPSQQMGPTKLTKALVNAIGRPTIRTQDSAKATKQLLGRVPSSTDVDHEHGHRRGDRHPQPCLLVGLTPAGLVGIHHASGLRMAVCFCHRKPDRFADVLLASRDRTDADVQPEYVGHDVFDEALALVVDAGQQRDHDLRVRAEVPSRHPPRQTSLCVVAAVFANSRKHLPLGNDRSDFWNIPNLMTPRTGQLDAQSFATTLLASTGLDDVDMIHFFLGQQLPGVPFVAGLRTLFALRFLFVSALFLRRRRVA